MLPIVKLRKTGICSADAGKTPGTMVLLRANVNFAVVSWAPCLLAQVEDK